MYEVLDAIKSNIVRTKQTSISFAQPNAFEFSRSRSNSKYAKNDVEPMLFRKQCLAFLSTDTARPLATYYLEFSNRLITAHSKFYKQIRIRFVFFAISAK